MSLKPLFHNILFSLLLILFQSSGIFGQSKAGNRNIFFDAESWVLFEDYKEALPLYQQLLKLDPTNSNYKFRIGQCYLNSPGEKEKAVSYLEDAVKDINPGYKDGKFNERQAPYDALYYLANAYRINNQLDKAIATYNIFQKNLNTQIYDSSVVRLQIQSCLNAKELMKEPLFIREKILDNSINENTSEFNPVVSDDENLLIFSRSEAFYDAILYSTKINGKWSNPLNMNELLKIDRDLFPTSLSKDGKTLYLYSSADYDGIIYSTHFVNGTWSPLVKLNDNINTKYWESHATISHDNKKLYFTSNRKGTIGGLDIYVSRRDSSGEWGPAENMGPIINTPFNEESPFLSRDDKTLFFSSRGHFNMGGYDIFYSTLLPNGKMSVPLNAGYPLNSTDDDVFFKPLNDGYEGYYAKESPGGFGKQDIYRIEIFSKDHPRKFLVRGTVKAADLLNNSNNSLKVLAMNVKKPNTTITAYSNPKTGEYELQLPQGKYEITYEGDDNVKITKNIELPLSHPFDTVVLSRTILPKGLNADLNTGNKNNNAALIPVKAKPSSDISIKSQKEATINISPEHTMGFADNKTEEFIAMLKKRSSDTLRAFLEEADLESQKFGMIDDVITYLKEAGAKRNINPSGLDRLALIVAFRDNVLSQAAIDYLAQYTDGDLKKILGELNINEANLKTWTDLQDYIQSKTNGKITPGELDKIVEAILDGNDPGILIIREKVLAYGNQSADKDLINKSVNIADQKDITVKEKWLRNFYDESLRQGLSADQLSELLATISNLPGTNVEKYLKDLSEYAVEPLLSSLKSLNLKEENVKSSAELISFLLSDKNKDKYPVDEVFKAIAALIVSKDIPEVNIASSKKTGTKTFPWIIPLILVLCVTLFFIFRKKRNVDSKAERKSS